MKCLIITTLLDTEIVQEREIEMEVFDMNNYKIGNCIGCNNCWLKTPGVCAIKDDWEKLFKKFLKADHVILVTEARLGFISFQMKNVVDRLIALILPYTTIIKGEARHTSRYGKCWKIGLAYSGEGNKDFLNEWMERLALNYACQSLGAYKINEMEELYHGISHI